MKCGLVSQWVSGANPNFFINEELNFGTAVNFQILYFWSISRGESLEFQQKHALRSRFLRTLLCSNDIFNPGFIRKMLMRKRASISDGVCFKYKQLFHPVQSTVYRIYQCSSRDELVLPRVTRILSVSG